MRKWWQRFALILTLVASSAATVLYCAYRMTQWEPSFYEQAVQAEPEILAQAGYELEQNVLALHNDLVDSARWESVITDAQINGWLAVDLPQKFPAALPATIIDPRVEILAGQVQIACRYDGPKLQAVVSVIIEPFLTDEPNVLAVRICQARLGALPVMKKRIVETVSSEAMRLGVSLTWGNLDGDPVALVTINPPADSEWVGLHVDALELQDGQLWVTGGTTEVLANSEAG